MSIHLHIYARRDIGHLVSCSDDAAIACGIGNVLGNKGGVAFSLRVSYWHRSRRSNSFTRCRRYMA